MTSIWITVDERNSLDEQINAWLTNLNREEENLVLKCVFKNQDCKDGNILRVTLYGKEDKQLSFTDFKYETQMSAQYLIHTISSILQKEGGVDEQLYEFEKKKKEKEDVQRVTNTILKERKALAKSRREREDEIYNT